MEKLRVQILSSLALLWLFHLANGNFSIRMEPPGPVKPGTHVKIICNVSKAYADSPVTWLRKTKSVEFQIARQQSLESTLYKNGRYILDTGGTNTGVLHALEIKPVQFEDIGEIGCTLEQSTKNPPKYISLIVCSDPDSDWCKCISKKKWADPECTLEASNASATNKRLKEGLGVCLGIAIVYGLIMTILAGIDCSSRLHEKRLRAQKKKEAQEKRRRNPYGESEELTLDISDPEQSMNASQEGRAPDARTPTDPVRYPQLTTKENGEPVRADVHGGNYGDQRDERQDNVYAPPAYPGRDPGNQSRDQYPRDQNSRDQYPREQNSRDQYPRDQNSRDQYPTNPYNDAAKALSQLDDYRNGQNDHYDGLNHRMEPLNTISQGYNNPAQGYNNPAQGYNNPGRLPQGQLPRGTNYNTPGKMSTHSADYDPQYRNTNNVDRLDYPNSRGAYSEVKPRQHGRQGHTGVEPRRLDFAHTKSAGNREPPGPYISPDTEI